MKLYCEERLLAMFYSFDRFVVLVYKPNLPAFGEGFCVYREAVVLACDVAFIRFEVRAWLILSAVAVFEFVSFRSCGESHYLVAEADSECWDFAV